ncbi:hypothetical protein [Lishizhenia tianjinensis]|nr:hypothetical protein [Lishizhenia tianjinensis]
MKHIKNLFICVVLFTCMAFQNSQNQQLKYFAQVQLNTNDASIQDEIEASIRNNPNCFVVRLDRITNGLLIVTKEINSFTKDDLTSWMVGNENVIECSRIGIQGLDDHFAFDDTFCDKVNQ